MKDLSLKEIDAPLEAQTIWKEIQPVINGTSFEIMALIIQNIVNTTYLNFLKTGPFQMSDEQKKEAYINYLGHQITLGLTKAEEKWHLQKTN